MTEEDARRYTMRVKDVAARLQCSRQTVHDLADSGSLNYRTRRMGKQDWRYFNPAEVERIAQERGVPEPEVPSQAVVLT